MVNMGYGDRHGVWAEKQSGSKLPHSKRFAPTTAHCIRGSGVETIGISGEGEWARMGTDTVFVVCAERLARLMQGFMNGRARHSRLPGAARDSFLVCV